MSKIDDFLAVYKENLGKWTCAVHTTGDNQPAATFREVKKLGYDFEEPAFGRWAKRMKCNICGKTTSHYKLLHPEPTFASHKRLTITASSRAHILKLFGNRDAFTGASISSTAEIDHRVPWTRLDKDIDVTELTDKEIKEHFQLLTREHNLLKDRACSHCKMYNERPPLFGIEFWYDGNKQYCGTCIGCGWYDSETWRQKLNDLLTKK